MIMKKLCDCDWVQLNYTHFNAPPSLSLSHCVCVSITPESPQANNLLIIVLTHPCCYNCKCSHQHITPDERKYRQPYENRQKKQTTIIINAPRIYTRKHKNIMKLYLKTVLRSEVLEESTIDPENGNQATQLI